MVAEPEVVRFIEEFHDELTRAINHQTHGTMTSQQLCRVRASKIPFEEESQDQLVLDTKKIAPPADVDALRRAHEVGQMQFENFVLERLVERTKPLEYAIHRNDLKIFGKHGSTAPGKGKSRHKRAEERGRPLLSIVHWMPEQRWESRRILPTRKPSVPPYSLRWSGIRFGVKRDLLA